MSDVIHDIRAFIGADPPRNRNAWFTSNAENGDHSVRQVNTYIEGWTVYTVTQAKSLKLKHLEKDPRASYLWVDEQATHRCKNVWMKGVVDVITDQAEVADFLKRRAEAFGAPHRYEALSFERYVTRFRPTYLRAESFESADSSKPPVVLRATDLQS